MQKLKGRGFYKLVFHIFINISRSKTIKKNLEHSFLEKNSTKSVKLMIDGARQSF